MVTPSRGPARSTTRRNTQISSPEGNTRSSGAAESRPTSLTTFTCSTAGGGTSGVALVARFVIRCGTADPPAFVSVSSQGRGRNSFDPLGVLLRSLIKGVLKARSRGSVDGGLAVDANFSDPYDGVDDVRLVIRDLGNDVYEIDTRMGGYHGITAGYLIASSRPALIETGAARSAPLLRDALGSMGIGASDLASVVVTHIHLDHAGGVGDIAAMFPQSQVVVHERGARHLAEPERLVASARRVFGDVMDELFGELKATPAQRIVSLDQSGTIDLGDGRRLEAFHAPGHASHHIALLDSLSGDLYTGDAAGVYIPETAEVRPATPPPDFDLELALASMRRIVDAGAQRLLFSHFGPVTNIDEVMQESVDELHRWVEIVDEARHLALARGLLWNDVDHAVALVNERSVAQDAAVAALPEVAEKFEVLSSREAQVAGILRYLGDPTVAPTDAN